MKKLCILLGLFSFALLLDSCASGYWRVGGNTKMVDPDFLNTRQIPDNVSKLISSADTILIINAIFGDNEFVSQTIQEIWPKKHISIVSYGKALEILKKSKSEPFQDKIIIEMEHECDYKKRSYSVDYTDGSKAWKSIEFTRYYYNFFTISKFGKFKLAKIDRYGSWEALIHPYSYNPDRFYNKCFGLDYLQLRQVFLDIDKNISRSNYEDHANKNLLKSLIKDTLYIPEYAMVKFNSFTGDESEEHNEKKIFSKYDFPYKIISYGELDRIIENKEPAFILEYVKNSNHKNIKVYHTTQGLSYFRFSYNTYNLKAKDLGRLYLKVKASQ